MRPTFTAEHLANVPEDEALQFFRTTLGWLLQCPNPYVVQLFAKEFHRDWQVEAGRWLLNAQRYGYLDEVMRDLRSAAPAPEDASNTYFDRFYRSFLSRVAESMSAYFFERIGWAFRAWNPQSFKQETPKLDVDFVLGTPDGRDALVQVKAPDVPGQIVAHQEIGGNNDDHIWMAMRKGLGQLPRPARAPAILVIHANRRWSLAYRPDPVDCRLLGTSVTDGDYTFIPHVYRGAFFEKPWSHIGAVVLLDNIRGPDEFLYTCTVYLNPNAEESARCEPSWFRGARVCSIDQGVVRWAPGPPELCVPEGTVIEPEPADAPYRPIDRDWWGDPVLGPTIRQLEAQQPEILEAVGEVDRSLIHESLNLPAADRLARSHALARSLAEVSHERR